jgi:hypothetical protein
MPADAWKASETHSPPGRSTLCVACYNPCRMARQQLHPGIAVGRVACRRAAGRRGPPAWSRARRGRRCRQCRSRARLGGAGSPAPRRASVDARRPGTPARTALRRGCGRRDGRSKVEQAPRCGFDVTCESEPLGARGLEPLLAAPGTPGLRMGHRNMPRGPALDQRRGRLSPSRGHAPVGRRVAPVPSENSDSCVSMV